MRRFDAELATGCFVVAGMLCLGYLSIRLGRMEVVGGTGYDLEARFSDVGGLKTGSSVVIAGVDIGRVKRIDLENYEAKVVFEVRKDIVVRTDSIVSVKTRGLIGEKYVDIAPGGSDEILKPGDRIHDTQPAVDLESLISKYAFGKLK